jgi:hypothetical protein
MPSRREKLPVGHEPANQCPNGLSSFCLGLRSSADPADCAYIATVNPFIEQPQKPIYPVVNRQTGCPACPRPAGVVLEGGNFFSRLIPAKMLFIRARQVARPVALNEFGRTI